MNQKENRRVRMTKQILADSLLELLEENDIHKISIRMLCDKADINRSTFYKYYGSQYDLLKEMETNMLRTIEATFSSDSQTASGGDKLADVLAFAEEHADLFRLLLNANVDSDFPKKLFTLPYIAEALNQKSSNAPQDKLIYKQEFIFYGGYQVIKRWINMDKRETPQEMAHIINSLLEHI